MRQSNSRAVVLFMMVAAAATAWAEQANEEKTPFLRFRLEGACVDLGSVRFIMAGDDGIPADITKVSDSPPEWTGKKYPPFLATGSTASVRLGWHRTECRRSTAAEDGGPIEAYFVFYCDPNPAWNVTIETEPHRRFRYVRYLKADQKSDCDCLEQADGKGTQTTFDVRLPDETINLRLGKSLWIHLNKVSIFMERARGARTQASLDRHRVAEEVAKSTFGEGFSANALAAIEKNPAIQELDNLTFTLANMVK